MSQSYQLFKKTNDNLLKEGDAYGNQVMHDITALINDPQYQTDLVAPVPDETYAYQIFGTTDFEDLKYDAMVNALRLEGFVVSALEDETGVHQIVTLNGQALQNSRLDKLRTALRKPKVRKQIYSITAFVTVLQVFVPYAPLSQRVMWLNAIWVIFAVFAIDYSRREAKRLTLIFPDLVGMPVAAARQAVEAQGYKVGTALFGQKSANPVADEAIVTAANRGLFGRTIELVTEVEA